MSNNNNSNQQGTTPSSVSLKLFIWAFSFGAALGSGVGYGLQNAMAKPIPEASNYALIQVGMSKTEARSLLGPGLEVFESEASTIIEWPSLSGQTIVAVFEGDFLSEKKQSRVCSVPGMN